MADARSARRVALDALRRIEDDGAYANLVLGPMLASSGLGDMDRRFVTELVYGTTRMRRACDSIIDRFVTSPPDDATRSVLRLGAYQLVFAGVAPHAAVGETVGLAPKRTRGFVNAVLRKVARLSVAEMTWPSDGARLSYPDWIVDTFRAEFGDDALLALERMNQAPPVTERADGYVQDESSQWVAAAVEAHRANESSTSVRRPAARRRRSPTAVRLVVANDQRFGRARLVQENAHMLDLDVPVVVGDGVWPPFPAGSFDAVLLDAPCSGLGALRRRADARWRIGPATCVELAALQGRSARRRRPNSSRPVVGSSTACARSPRRSRSTTRPRRASRSIRRPPPVGTWRPFGQGWRVLPHDADTDGMVMIRYRRTT